MARHPEFANLEIIEHPLIQQKLATIRDRCTSPANFRRLLNEIAALMTFEASRHFETQ